MGLLRSLSCLLLLLLVPASHQATCSNNDTCLNQPDCTDCTNGDKVPNPENCRGYYLCDTDGPATDFPLDCPTGQVFNATLHECVLGTECDECAVVPTPGDCKYECLEDFSIEKVASFTDCGVYYICPPDATSDTTAEACEAPTPFFNGEECQAEEKLCCHCKPFCDSSFTAPTQVADPLNCHKYYLCLTADAGEVPTNGGSCPDGENFDAFLGQCSAAAACATHVSCINVVGANGCIDPFTCLTDGYFAGCPNQCTPYYYHCTEATGTFQDVETCTEGLVFHPDSHTCVTEENCPY